jgi:hypothetical protein
MPEMQGHYLSGCGNCKVVTYLAAGIAWSLLIWPQELKVITHLGAGIAWSLLEGWGLCEVVALSGCGTYVYTRRAAMQVLGAQQCIYWARSNVKAFKNMHGRFAYL